VKIAKECCNKGFALHLKIINNLVLILTLKKFSFFRLSLLTFAWADGIFIMGMRGYLDKYQHPIIYALSSYHSRQGCKP